MLRCPKSSVHHAAAQRCSKSVLQHAPQLCSAARSRSQIRSAAPAAYPTPAEVSRTVLDLGNDGTLSTISSACGTPLGTPVSYSLDKQGQPHLHLELGSLELANLAKNPSCSLLVTPTSFPARAVASVALSGTIVETPAEDPSAPSTYCLKVEKAIYFGGLDQSLLGLEISGADYQAAEPDVLRKAAAELVATWNNDRAEDIYRIVSDFLAVPLTEMSYAELLWVDRLGMYVRIEMSDGSIEPQVVRVPFYRPVLDERDARSVITMAAQIAWERDRSMPLNIPAIFSSGDSLAAVASLNK